MAESAGPIGPTIVGGVCVDCGARVEDEGAHVRFHSILSSHAWALAVLQTAHVGPNVHDRYDVRERVGRRKFDNWSADAFREVTGIDATADGDAGG